MTKTIWHNYAKEHYKIDQLVVLIVRDVKTKLNVMGYKLSEGPVKMIMEQHCENCSQPQPEGIRTIREIQAW